MIRVIEQSCVSKTGKPEVCEDAICVTEDFACLVDGATAKGIAPIDGKSVGRIAAELVCRHVPRFPRAIDCPGAFDILTDSIRSFCEEHGLARDRRYRKAISAALAIYSDFRREIWSVGDCHIVLDGRNVTQTHLLDEVASNTRSLFLELELASGKTQQQLLEHDTGRDFIMPLLERQYRLQNPDEPSPYGYAALDGSAPGRPRIRRISVPWEARTLVFASDGYPEPRPTLAEAERALSDLLSRDPLCFRMAKGTKGCYPPNLSYDDRAYLSIDPGE